MQSYFSKRTLRFSFLLFIFSVFLICLSEVKAKNPFILSPKDTTLVVEKDIHPKITNREEKLIEGKRYIFATINGKKGMVARAENFLSEMARAAGVEPADFLEWNDMKPTDPIQTEQVYYLEKKGKRAEDVTTHILLQNETLWTVSQKYAIQYKYVLKYNRLDEDDQVKTGRVLWIQTKRPKRIPVEIKEVTPIVASFEEGEGEEEAADPELMAEWEELKKTELAGMENKNEENTSSQTTKQKTKNTTASTTTETKTTEKGTFAEFENTKKTEGVLIEEKKENRPTNAIKYHTVAEAESLYDVSKKYNVIMPTLKEWNNLTDYTVYTGQILIVSKPSASSSDKVYEGNFVTDKTKKTDKKVMVAQNPDGTFVTLVDSAGVLLPVPKQDFRPTTPDFGKADYHIVEQDETLWSIARKYKLSPSDVIRWNGFITGDNIDVGDKIIINPALALEEGSRAEEEKNLSQNNPQTNISNNQNNSNSEFKDPSIRGGNQNTEQKQANNTNSSQTNASKLTREEIIAMGGNPENVGKEGYDAIGMPILGYKPTNTELSNQDSESVKTYVIQPKDMLGKIAQQFGVTTKELIEWNPKIPVDGKIFKGDTLIVSKPKAKVSADNSVNQATATVYPKNYYGAGYHAVQPNENIYNISKVYGVSVMRLREINNLSENTVNLEVGTKIAVQEIAVQGDNSSQNQESSQSTENTAKVQYSYHSVAKGETLFSIAQKYNLSTAQIREWNNRQGDLVYEGEKLIVGIK